MLLGVNLFLLVRVAGREARSAQYLERARDEAVSILEKNGIAMTAALPREMTLTAMTVTRDAAAEQAQAAGLLGEAAAAEDGSSNPEQTQAVTPASRALESTADRPPAR